MRVWKSTSFVTKKSKKLNGVNLIDRETGISFNQNKVFSFKPFKHGKAIFGGFFGDEGKGKEVDITAENYKKQGLKILSIRGQGSGNAGHTIVANGVKYDFHYLTSAGLLADIMLLGPGMLIDPIRLLDEIQKLPEDKRKIVMVAERATIVSDVERTMDSWCEIKRKNSGQIVIGTTGSGVGPGSGNRGYRFHVTFADALVCSNVDEFRNLYLRNPILPDEVKATLTKKYAQQLWDALEQINIVDSIKVVQECRNEEDWAVLLEVSQAVALDPLFGNGGHYCTSTPCTDIGGAAFAGLTRHDFPDGSVMVLKAYGSKVGGGPYITKFIESEKEIDDFIDEMVGEHGVTTGRKRDLGWFDAPAVRHAIALTGADICVNCMDVIASLPRVTSKVKVCFAYQNKKNGEVTYSWPYDLPNYTPLFVEMDLFDGQSAKSEEQIIAEYILLIEEIIGQKIVGYGVGPSRNGYKEREEAFKNFS